MIKVIGFKFCSFIHCGTVRIEAKNTPYEIEFISLSDKP